MKTVLFYFLVAALFIGAKSIVDIRSFFPFGVANGDQYLAAGDDTYSAEQPLTVPFNFFNFSHTSLWVNVNGAISFLSPITTYTPTCQPVSRDFRMVSPFWADVDTKYETPSPASAVSFRESTNPSDLQQAEREVMYAFNLTSIDLTWTYIVTWYNVTFYNDDPSRNIRNSFQAILTTNGDNSFVIFLYNKIQWTTGSASNGDANGLGGTPAQVGFDAGDGENRYMLNVSCTNDVLNVNNLSNIGVPGEFVFQVDSDVIHTPPPITRPTRPTLPPTIAGSTLPPLSPTMPPSTTTSAPPKGLDRNCGCTRNKIWLDIVAVMDNSLSMGQTGFAQIQANLASIVGQLTLSSVPGYSSRISLVTFASAATKVADLNAFNDTNMFMKKLFAIPVANDDKVNILSGLQMANTILGNNVVANRRRVVILYTSAYDDTGSESPVSLALNMREDNIKIITIAFSQKMGSDEVNKVGELAWPSFDFVNEEPGLPDKMYNALCQTNCFCPPNWQQYTTNITDQYAPGYGVCLYLSSITSAWIPASFACGNEVPGAYLTTESTSEKHNFNLAYAKKSNNSNGVYSYHIGLQYQNGQYSWQQFNGSNPVPLDNSYTYWNAGYPNQNIGECVKVDRIFGSSYRWTNVNCYSSFLNYICEVYTCDTDNYCPPNKR
uniref:Uncharacterized protein n=1 Tax=Panagrolaimus davidi TaxID=227884 RepID=A0A914QBN4_9BILA